MNTIPTTFRQSKTPYTVIGGKKTDRIRKYIYPIAFIILNRRGRFYRESIIRHLSSIEAGEIIYVTDSKFTNNLNMLERDFPAIRILHLKRKTSPGEKINIAIDESKARWCFILWDDMELLSAQTLMNNIMNAGEETALCTVPIFKNKSGVTMPSIVVPGFVKGELKVFNWLPKGTGAFSIYPFDYCGLYNKEKFLLSGGYDYTFLNPYWQKLDFGFRVYMWGEKIVCNPVILLKYREDMPEEDSTPDESYKYFYLKNMAIRFKGDNGILPWSQFLHFMMKSDSGPINAFREFLLVRKWVRINKFRFKQDALRVIDLWEVE